VALGLDLATSDEKVNRARVHCDTLKTAIQAHVNERKPYALEGVVDHETGWYSASIVAPPLRTEYGLSIVVGDLIHNLRCALDYIITALVKKSDATLTRKHQFPIFDDCATYKRDVGNASEARKGGMLDGVRCGLQEIWDLQPFQRADPVDDPLFMINRFSNTDKHRMILEIWVNVGRTTISLHAPGGVIVEEVDCPVDIDLEPNTKYEIVCVRFAKPYPPQARVETHSPNVSVIFGAPPFDRFKDGHMLEAPSLQAACDYVAQVVDAFKRL